MTADREGGLRPLRGAILTTALFLSAAIALADIRSLWLDEVLQLIDTRQPSVSELIRRLPYHSGGAPLGYLVQQASLKITGYSVRRARLPEVVFGAAAVFLVALLARELGLKRAWLAAAIFALLPLTFRYATEARMYSQAMFFSVLATLLYLRMARKPGWPAAAAYCLALVAAVYTQPYAASVGLAHVLWSLRQKERRTALAGAAALALMALAFLPWYLSSKAQWAEGMAFTGQHFSASLKTPLMLFRELAGAGYWGSTVLLAMCVLALTGRNLPHRARELLLLLVAAPAVTVFLADAWSDYFLAARQFLWVLPSIAILAAAAIEERPRAGLALGVLLAAVCTWMSVRFSTAPRENWEAASDALAAQVQHGACLSVAPPESARLYEFFRPDLARARCAGPTVVLAITPYTTSGQRRAAVAALLADGYEQVGETTAGRSGILSFRRHQH